MASESELKGSSPAEPAGQAQDRTAERLRFLGAGVSALTKGMQAWIHYRPRRVAGGPNALLLVVLMAANFTIIGFLIVSRNEVRRAEIEALKHLQESQESAEGDRRLATEANEARVRQEGVLRQIETEAAGSAKVAELLIGMFQGSDPAGLGNYSFFAPAVTADQPSAREMLKHGAAKVLRDFKSQPALQARLMDTVGNIYRRLGHYQEAEQLLRGALELRQRNGAPDLDLAASLHSLAWWHHDQANYVEAERLYREALALRIKLLGSDDLAVAATKFNLAWLLGQSGNSTEPEQLFQDVLAVRRKHLGDQHRDVGLALFGLAAQRIAQRRLLVAIEPSLAAMRLLSKQEAAGNLAMATGLFQMGLIAKHAGYRRAAEPLLRKCLPLVRQSLGERHVYVALIEAELADLVEQTGNQKEAETHYRACLVTARLTVGFEHPRVLKVVTALAGLLEHSRRYPEGEQLYRDVLDATRRRFGDQHVQVAEILCSFARFVERHDSERSEQLRREADGIFRSGDGAGSRAFATNLNNWAVLVLRKGQPVQAEKLFREALPLERHYFGKNDPVEVATVLDNLATALLDQEKRSEAEPLLQEALALVRADRSGDALIRLHVLEDLGRCCRERGRIKEAEQLYREALLVARTEFASYPRELAHRVSRVAEVLAELSNFEEAAEFFAEVLRLHEQSRKPDDSEIANALCNLGLARLAAGDGAGYRAVCARLLDQFGNTPNAATAERIARTVALAAHATGDWDRTLHLAERAFEASGRSPAKVPALGAALYRAGRFDEAAVCLEQALAAQSSPYESLFLTMAYERLNKKAAAQQGLDSTLRKLGQTVNTRRSWQERVELQFVRREADTLLHGAGAGR